MTFLNPVWLWGMVGITVPIIIHLWSKQDAEVIKIGSIRLLQEQESVKSSRLYLNEVTLLVIRSLIIVVLSLVLAKPSFFSDVSTVTNNLAILVEPSLANSLEDYIPNERLEAASFIGIMEFGLPLWEPGKVYPKASTNYWQLIPEIENLKEDNVLIISQNRLNKVKGRRPYSSKEIVWIQSAPATDKAVIKAMKLSVGVNVWMSDSKSGGTSVTRREITELASKDIEIKKGGQVDSVRSATKENWIPITSPKVLEVGIVHNVAYEAEIFYLTKSLETIGEYLEREIHFVSIEGPALEATEFDLVINLNNDTIPGISGQLLITHKKDEFAKLIDEADSDGKFYLTDKLNLDNVVQRGLTKQLMNILEPNIREHILLEKYDLRTIDQDQLKPKLKEHIVSSMPEQSDASLHFWLILLVLVGIERVLSLIRKQ